MEGMGPGPSWKRHSGKRERGQAAEEPKDEGGLLAGRSESRAPACGLAVTAGLVNCRLETGWQ
jgi:hypothetical protein